MNATLENNAVANQPQTDGRSKKQPRPHPHRWWITFTLATTTPLAVGDGTTYDGEKLDDNKFVQVNAVSLNAAKKPYLSGTALKGALRALAETYAEANSDLKELIPALFGSAPANTSKRQSGLVSFYDAHFMELNAPEAALYLANFNLARHTYQETSTRIDRDRGTADDRKLFTNEYVAVGATFSGTMLVQHHDEVAGGAIVKHLAGLLNAATNNAGLALGAETRRGYGRLTHEDFKVKVFGEAQLKAWCAKRFVSNWQCYAEENKEFTAVVLNPPTPTTISLNLQLQFQGLFLVNEPAHTKIGEGAINHAPRTDAGGKLVLPAKTLQGALRSQSEKILRTMGIACSGAGGAQACEKALDDSTILAGDALITALYGNTQQASALTQPKPPALVANTGSASHTQDFVAIDRFTGGGKDGAKFNAKSIYQPKFDVTLQIPSTISDAAKGLLLLTLRDLAEGDIPMGWGKRKGYGACVAKAVQGNRTSDLIPSVVSSFGDDAQVANQLQALRTLRANASETATEININAIGAHFKTEILVKPAPPTAENATTNRFHNTYHFIPAEAADLPMWVKREDFGSASAWAKGQALHSHSHAQYGLDIGNTPLYSGEIACSLTSETPFIVGGARNKNADGSHTVAPYQINEQILIPASSLKGMIGAIAEAASGSALRVFDAEAIISYRFKAKDALTSLGVFWPDSKNNLGIKPLAKDNDYEKIDVPVSPKVTYHALKLPTLPTARLMDSPKPRKEIKLLKALDNVSARVIPVAPTAVADFELLADELTKLFLGKDAAKPVFSASDLSLNVLKALPYHRVESVPTTTATGWAYKQSSLIRNKNATPAKTKLEQLVLRPKQGDLVYYEQRTDVVSKFSYSAIWRGLIKNSELGKPAVYRDFLANSELQPFAPHVRQKISPAEMLLGFVEIMPVATIKPLAGLKVAPQAFAFAGKLRFTDGLAKTTVAPMVSIPLKLLSSPKPPSPALYFAAKAKAANVYIPKPTLSPTLHRIHGRKVYLHAFRSVGSAAVQPLNANGYAADNGTLPWAAAPPVAPLASRNHAVVPAVDKNAAQRVHAKLLPEGNVFDFSVAFDNLSHHELELLAFSLEPDAAFRHKLGMGKAIGLGTVRIEAVATKLVNRQNRYNTDALIAPRFQNMPAAWLAQLATTYREASNGSTAAKTALLAIGNPANVIYPVHVPQIKNKPIEVDSFDWFENNDNDGNQAPLGQCLPKITTARALPSLERRDKYVAPANANQGVGAGKNKSRRT